MMHNMRYASIEKDLAPYHELIQTIPDGEVQGKKVARILIHKMEDYCQTMAEME